MPSPNHLQGDQVTPQTPTARQQQQQDTHTSTPSGSIKTSTPTSHRVSPHIRPSPTPTTASPSSLLKHRHISRIAPPALLPPILDRTNSALHLTLHREAGSTLSTQVDELLSRHLAAPGGNSRTHVSSGNPVTKNSKTDQPNQDSTTARALASVPPALPPKPSASAAAKAASPAGPRAMASPQLAQPRKPLPIPPNQPVPYQYPASYGPSVSKIRSFPADPPFYSQDLPPGAAHMPSVLAPGRQGLGYGYPHPAFGGSSSADFRDFRPFQQQQSTVSRTFAKGGASVMLHKGFFDLLSISQHNAEQNAISTLIADSGQGWLGDKPIIPASGRAVTTPIYKAQAQSASAPPNKGYRRISVDMISKPTGFA